MLEGMGYYSNFLRRKLSGAVDFVWAPAPERVLPGSVEDRKRAQGHYLVLAAVNGIDTIPQKHKLRVVQAAGVQLSDCLAEAADELELPPDDLQSVLLQHRPELAWNPGEL
jgi:hypothetical protein